MLVCPDEAQAHRSQRMMVLPPPLRKRKKPDRPQHRRKTLLWCVALTLIIMSGLLANWSSIIPTAFAAPQAFNSTPGHLTAQQYLQNAQPGPKKFQRPTDHTKGFKVDANDAQNKRLPSSEPATMKDLTYTLDSSFVVHGPKTSTSQNPPTVVGTTIPGGNTPFQIKGSDGRLDVDLARDSLDFSKATLADGSAPVGPLLLQLHQITGHFQEESSILGTYQIQVIDSQGHEVQGAVLTQPLTVVYHYQPWELSDLHIDPTQVVLSWSTQLASAEEHKQSTAGLVQPMINDATAQTLMAQGFALGGVVALSSTPTISAPTAPDLFEANGNNGQYDYGYPLTVVPGPDGFGPKLQLSYSSLTTNTRYSSVVPANDAGDGWTLSLGSITVSTSDVTSTGGAQTWYSINGVDGISDKLVPSPTGQTTTYETEHLSHLKIKHSGSIWQVWGLDGTYYEFGNGGDSVRTTSAGTYQWDLNKVLAPFNSTSQVKTMFITYYRESPDGGTTTRDSGLKQIKYGFATSSSATSLSLVAGTIDFHYHGPVTSAESDGQGNKFSTAYGTNYHCSSPPSSTTMRCDDPVTFNSVPPPAVMPTLELDSVVSYAGTDTSNSNKAYRYNFTYQDTPYTTSHFDPFTFVQSAAAGEHLLTQISPLKFIAGTGFPRAPMVFGYSGALHDSYADPSVLAVGGSQHFSGQTFWKYLTFYEDTQTGTGANISYATAFANMNGTPDETDNNGNVTDDRYDPLFCTFHTTCTGNYAHPEDYSWSLQVVTQIAALGTDSSGNSTVSTTQYFYDLAAIPSDRTPVSSCHPITGSGVPAAEASCVGDNWAPGYDGTSTPDHDGNWHNYYDSEFRGFNVVFILSPAGNLTDDYYIPSDGWWTPTSNGANYNSGQLYQEDIYQGTETLLRETDIDYTGVGDTPSGNSYGNINSCSGSLNPIYNPCVVAPLEKTTFFYEGKTTQGAPWVDTKYTYDDLNGIQGFVSSSTAYHNLLQQVTTGSNLPSSIYPVTQKWTYTPNNGTDSNGNFHYDVNKVSHSEVDDHSGHIWQCQDTIYDEGVSAGTTTPSAGLPTTTKSYSACGNTSTALTSYTAYDQYGNVVASVDQVGVANPSLYSSHGCSVSTVAYASASWTIGHYTDCTTYDTGNTASLPTASTNALGQTSSMTYDYSASLLPDSSTDANGQTTNFSNSFDGSGNETIFASAPGETGSYTNKQAENTTCVDWRTLVTAGNPNPSQSPCYRIENNPSLYSSAIGRTYYDAQGRAVETRTPGPTPGDDTVVATIYNDQDNSVWTSVPFQVASGSGWLDPTTVKDINGNAPAGTVTFRDSLGRTIAVQDPNFGSSQEPGLTCSATLTGHYTSCLNYSFGTAAGTSDTNTYKSVTTIDPNGHVSVSFSDVSDEILYSETNSGVYGGTLTLQKLTTTQYTPLHKPTSVVVTDEAPQSGQSITSVTTTATYDDLGRQLTATDPDQGTFTSSYDPDGHVLSVTQTSGTNSRTLGYNYDLLGRTGCVQTAAPTLNATGACSAGNPLVQNTYDTTKLGTQGTTDFPIGRLTQSVATTYYPDSTSATVTQKVQTDLRGRTTNTQMQLALPSGWGVTTSLPLYQLSASYNTANQITTTTATAGTATYSFSPVYDTTSGSLKGLSSGTSSSTANLVTLAYNEFAQLSTLTLLNGSSTQIASMQYGYDGDLRPSSLTSNWLPGSGNSGQILSKTLTYDNGGNVTSSNTFFAAVPGQSGSGGSEVQNFCYDEQSRLIWSGNGGTQPGTGNGTCGAGTLANSLTGAGYTAPYTYTNLGQIWQGPLNGTGTTRQYLYCDSSHPHQLTGIYPAGTTCSGLTGAIYTASFDAFGNQTGRMSNSITATLSYDVLNRLTTYSTGSNQEFYLYDASGNRVLKRSITGTGTTLTAYAYGLQELSYTGAGAFSSQIDYYSVASHLVGSTNGSTTTYDLTDAQGSVLTTLSTSAVLGEQTYGPYGNQRYTQGSMGTDKGYMGQFQDAVTGLDYYNARYYDPMIGQFLSADNVQGNAQGMNPYAYVAENPETKTDPTGHRTITCTPDENNCGRDGNPDCPSGTSWSNGACEKNSKPQPPGPTAGDCQKQGLVLKGGGCVYVPPTCQQQGQVSQNGKCVTPKKPCDEKCRVNDLELLLAQQQASAAIGGDIGALLSAIAAIIIDIAGGVANILITIQDVISAVPVLTKLIGDIVTATGHAIPPVLANIQYTFTMVIGIMSLLKGYSYIVWAISGFVNPVLGLAKPVLVQFVGSGLSALGTGISSLFSLAPTGQDLNLLTNDQLQAACHIDGCE